MVKDLGPDPDRTQRIIHKRCGHLLEYSPSDVSRHKHIDISGHVEFFWAITCPFCRAKVEVEKP